MPRKCPSSLPDFLINGDGQTVQLSDLAEEVAKAATSNSDELTIRLVTPMFGGGVTAGENDSVTPVSGKSIRGHLRYWWRIMLGSRLEMPDDFSDSVEFMNIIESEIFGSPEIPGLFDIVVSEFKGFDEKRELKDPTDDKKAYGFAKFGTEAYALFSAKNNNVGSLVKEGATFKLSLCWPTEVRFEKRWEFLAKLYTEKNNAREVAGKSKLPDPVLDIEKWKSQVKTALWAWINFGGIGGRTRMGVGSIATDSADYSLMNGDSLRYDVSDIKVYRSNTPSNGSKTETAEMKAWANAVNTYKSFRIDGKIARSKWSEPDSIRELSNCALKDPKIAAKDHTKPVVDACHIGSYPRSALGMPIIFQFKDGPKKGEWADPKKDPPNAEVVPRVLNENGKLEVGKRMASPVITRPIKIDNKWHAALIVLPLDHIQSLEAHVTVKDAGKSQDIANDKIMSTTLATLKPMGGKENAVDALIAHAKQFREIPASKQGE